MSYTFLLETGEESSAECFSDIDASVLSSLKSPVERRCSNARGTESFHDSQSGTTLDRSAVCRGGMKSTPCVVDSHVRECLLLDAGSDLKTRDLDCGRKWPASLAKWDRDTSLWKTHQHSVLGGLVTYSETWPEWGMTVGGVAYRQPTPSMLVELRHWTTFDLESGFSERAPTCHGFSKDGKSNGPSGNELGRWVNTRRVPTPTKCQSKGSSQASLTRKDGSDRTNDRLDHFVMATTGGSLNPTWVEWLMGWPIGWTDLQPLEMGKFQQWLHSHGDFSVDRNASPAP